jgi:hypothetical protein
LGDFGVIGGFFGLAFIVPVSGRRFCTALPLATPVTTTYTSSSAPSFMEYCWIERRAEMSTFTGMGAAPTADANPVSARARAARIARGIPTVIVLAPEKRGVEAKWPPHH